MTTALLDDAAERAPTRRAKLIGEFLDSVAFYDARDVTKATSLLVQMCHAIALEATEAAALKCEAIHDAGLRSHLDYYDACKRCAAAIRGGQIEKDKGG